MVSFASMARPSSIAASSMSERIEPLLCDGGGMQQNSGLPTFGNASLRGLARLRDAKRRRASSWDRTGGNEDCLTIPAGETATLGDIGGAGSITHIWFTISSADPLHLRNLVLRMYWDGEAVPSV